MADWIQNAIQNAANISQVVSLPFAVSAYLLARQSRITTNTATTTDAPSRKDAKRKRISRFIDGCVLLSRVGAIVFSIITAFNNVHATGPVTRSEILATAAYVGVAIGNVVFIYVDFVLARFLALSDSRRDAQFELSDRFTEFSAMVFGMNEGSPDSLSKNLVRSLDNQSGAVGTIVQLAKTMEDMAKVLTNHHDALDKLGAFNDDPPSLPKPNRDGKVV